MINWVKKRCVICGSFFELPEGSLYQPLTCSSYECVHKLLHPTLYAKGGDAKDIITNLTLAKQDRNFKKEEV